MSDTLTNERILLYNKSVEGVTADWDIWILLGNQRYFDV